MKERGTAQQQESFLTVGESFAEASRMRCSPAFSAQPLCCRLNPISIELKAGKRWDRLLARDKSKQSSINRGPISSLKGYSVELTPLL
jgi:hypothetical protein